MPQGHFTGGAFRLFHNRLFGLDFFGGFGLAAAFFELYGEFWNRGVLDHASKETARVRNARITDCGY